MLEILAIIVLVYLAIGVVFSIGFTAIGKAVAKRLDGSLSSYAKRDPKSAEAFRKFGEIKGIKLVGLILNIIVTWLPATIVATYQVVKGSR